MNMLISHLFTKRTVPYGWCMNPKFVGHAVALEVSELYYAKNNFQIWDAELFPKIFPIIPPRNSLGTEVQTFKWIRRLELVWDIDCTKPIPSEERCDNLYHLTLISRKELLRFTLTIRGFEDEFWSAHRTLNTLEMLRKPVYDLKHAGSTIRIEEMLEGPNGKNRELIDWWPASGSADSGSCGFFQLSLEDWEKARIPVPLFSSVCTYTP